jgi:hypothetical protein
VLSDGDEYRFYNANAPLDAEEKLFWRVKLSDENEADTIQTLTLISRSNMEENLLDVLWKAHYVDRRVKFTLHQLFSTLDRSLIRLIRQREPKLTPKEIAESLQRLDPRFGPTTPLPDLKNPLPNPPKPSTTARIKRARPATNTAKNKKHFGVSLNSLIENGYLKPPVRLFRKYKGKIMEAMLRPDGSVEFQGKRFRSCSTAAEFARSTLTGRSMNTNGWDFWQLLDENNKATTLFAVREGYLSETAQD